MLEAKLSQALQDQNVLLGENQRLRQEIKDTQQQTISTLEGKEEENEQLREEIEQMRMNHALEMGLVEDSNVSEEVTSLKEELERAHKRIEELEGTLRS